MKLEQTFIGDVWEETGEMGFRPEYCSPAFDPINYPPGLAHDFIEHAGDFTVEGEIKAHAAIYLLRYETGFQFQGQWNPLTLEGIGSEWVNLYRGIQEEGCLDSCPDQEPLSETIEEELAAIISHGKRSLLDEVGKEYLDTNAYTQLSKYFANWFRLGYRETEERFAAIGINAACNALYEVCDYFEQTLREEIIGGERITITLDLESGDVTFSKETECWACGTICDSDIGICEDCDEDA